MTIQLPATRIMLGLPTFSPKSQETGRVDRSWQVIETSLDFSWAIKKKMPRSAETWESSVESHWTRLLSYQQRLTILASPIQFAFVSRNAGTEWNLAEIRHARSGILLTPRGWTASWNGLSQGHLDFRHGEASDRVPNAARDKTSWTALIVAVSRKLKKSVCAWRGVRLTLTSRSYRT